MDPKDRDSGVNPADSHYDDDFFAGQKSSNASNNLKSMEEGSAKDLDDNLPDVKEQEQSGSQWDNNVNKASSQLEKAGGVRGRIAAKALRSANNNFGPIGAILALGIVMILGAAGTGLIMPMQLTELFTAELSDSSGATQVRSSRLLSKKLDPAGDVGQICQTTGIKCRFKTMSDRQIQRYRDAGFEVETSNKTLGRSKVESISIEVSDGFDSDGNPRTKTLSANNAREFNNLRRTDTDFRKTSSAVYNSRVHSYFGNKFNGVLGRLNINRMSKLSPEDTKESNLKKINSEIGAKENAGIRDGRGNLVDEDATRTAHKDDFDKIDRKVNTSEQDLRSGHEDFNSRSQGQNGEVDLTRSGQRIGGAAGTAANGACAAYELPRLVTAGVKAVKITKLTAYAMVILSEVHKVKAGEDTSGRSMQLIGEILSSGNSSKTNISDSTSMQLALTGSSPGITPGSGDFVLSSGGLVGALESFNNFTSTISNRLGRLFTSDQAGVAEEQLRGEMTIRYGCLAAEVGSYALLLAPPVGWAMGLLRVTLEVALDIVIGYVAGEAIQHIITNAASMALNADTSDGNAADAIFAGRALIDNSKSAAYGLGPSKLHQIEEYTAFRNQVSNYNIAMDIEDAKDTPFDIYNQYSFLGMTLRNINLSVGMSSSLPQRAVGLLSLMPSALSTAIMPSAGAAYSQPHAKFKAERYDESNDPAIARIGAAPDAFGNVRYSMSPRERNMDGEKVADFLIRHGYVDEETGEPIEDHQQGRRFKNYQEFCAERKDPIGESSQPMNSLIGGEVLKSNFRNRPLETMAEFSWHTGHSCVHGQLNTFNEGPDPGEHPDNRDEWIKEIDSSYLVPEEWRDTAMLTGRMGAKVASTSTENLVASAGSPAEIELELFRVFTMDMALLDDIDGETPQPEAAASSSGGTGAQGEVSPDGWAYPTDSVPVLSSGFGPRWGSMHNGIDLADGGVGSPIFAARDGRVIESGPAGGFGNWIVIQHEADGQRVDTVYGHMFADGVFVDVGDTVSAGQEIGTIGNAGQSSGAHLHFEIWQGGHRDHTGGTAVDPEPIIMPLAGGGG